MNLPELKEQIEKLPDDYAIYIDSEGFTQAIDIKALAAAHTALEQRVAQYEKVLDVTNEMEIEVNGDLETIVRLANGRWHWIGGAKDFDTALLAWNALKDK
jgi:hypothetical protein